MLDIRSLENFNNPIFAISVNSALDCYVFKENENSGRVSKIISSRLTFQPGGRCCKTRWIEGILLHDKMQQIIITK